MSRMTSAKQSVDSEVVRFLSAPATYSSTTTAVESIETHISRVFLTDKYAFKLKKPVRFDFLDFTSLKLRQQACEEEVRLNRRLAPATYLGVVALVRDSDGHLQLDGEGTPVDWLVKMRRLPRDRALDQLITSGQVEDRQIEQVATMLSTFYRQLPPLSVRTDEYRKQVEDHVCGNWLELGKRTDLFDAHVVNRVHAAQIRLLRLMPEILDDRVRDGRIVEGHGDLRPEHVYLTLPPSVIDCIEFSAELRQLDVLDELSFLAMECAFLDAPQVGGRILDRYCFSSGDNPPRELLPFYLSYRACVRAKVFALRAGQLQLQTQGGAAQLVRDATKYLGLAQQYASELGPPLLLIVRGLTGVGKSTLAQGLAESLGVELLQTDAIRRDLFGASPFDADYNTGHYTSARRSKVYAAMLQRAAELLDQGLSVVLDGTFLTTKLRAQAISLGRRHNAFPQLIHCHCDDELAVQRITSRDGSLSESRPSVYFAQQKEEQPDPTGAYACQVDTTNSLPAMLRTVFKQVAARYRNSY